MKGSNRIKDLLLKNINIKRTYLLGVVVTSLVLVVLLFSYAIFTATVEQKGVLNIMAGNLYSVVESDTIYVDRIQDKENNVFDMYSEHQIVVDVTLRNVNSVPVVMKLYWKFTDGTDDGKHYVSVIEETDDGNVATNGITLAAYGHDGDTKTVKVLIDNTDSEFGGYFQLGAVVGLQGYDLEIPSDAKRLTSRYYTPEQCFEFDSSTGTITKYLCGPIMFDPSAGYVENTSLPEGIDEVISDVVMPRTINGITVTTIGEWAFEYKGVTSVIIPDSVTTIGADAFVYNSLTSITIPNSVETIGVGAFRSTQLKSVTIPSSVKTMGDYVFMENKLESVTIKGKSSTSDFTNYGTSVFDWAEGYSDANITWEP